MQVSTREGGRRDTSQAHCSVLTSRPSDDSPSVLVRHKKLHEGTPQDEQAHRRNAKRNPLAQYDIDNACKEMPPAEGLWRSALPAVCSRSSAMAVRWRDLRQADLDARWFFSIATQIRAFAAILACASFFNWPLLRRVTVGSCAGDAQG